MSEETYVPVDETQVEQRTLDWYRSRLGFWTGSCMGKLMGKSRDGGFSSTAMSYIYQVAAERYMNPLIVRDDELFAEYIDQHSRETKAMRLGMEKESEARALYERVTGKEVSEVGSVRCDSIPHLAASPDGVTADGVLEIKSPTQAVYMRYRAEARDADGLRTTQPDYYWQVMTEMLCVGKPSGDIVFYNPFQACPLHVVHLDMDEEAARAIAERVRMADEIIASNESYFTNKK